MARKPAALAALTECLTKQARLSIGFTEVLIGSQGLGFK